MFLLFMYVWYENNAETFARLRTSVKNQTLTVDYETFHKTFFNTVTMPVI